MTGTGWAGVKRYLGLETPADDVGVHRPSIGVAVLVFVAVVAGFVGFGLLTRDISDDVSRWILGGFVVVVVALPRLRDHRKAARGRSDGPPRR